MLSRCWCHTVLDVLLRYVATIRSWGSWTHRHLHGTEGSHFQTILRISGYHWDHRKGTVGFGETPAEFKPRIKMSLVLNTMNILYSLTLKKYAEKK